MRYFVYRDDTYTFYTNMFEAANIFTNAEFEDETNYLAVGLEIDNSTFNVFHKAFKNDVIVIEMTEETQIVANQDYKYFDSDIKREFEFLIELFKTKSIELVL